MRTKLAKEKIICVDIDDVCARLVPQWLRLYNGDYGDNLREEDILTWCIGDYVKEECGDKIYQYMNLPDIYNNIKPVRGAIEYTRKLKEAGLRLVYVTFRAKFSLSGRKYEWLNRNGFGVENKDYIETNDKSLILADYMIDDNYENVKAFRGMGVLYTKPWNISENHYQRVDNWKEFYKFILEREGKQGWLEVLNKREKSLK